MLRPNAEDDNKFLNAHRFARKQQFYFFLWNCVPVAASAMWFFFNPQLTVVDVIMFLVMFFLTFSLGMTVGYHRYFTHGSFEAHPVLQGIMAACGGMSAQGPISYWVAIHRCHHQHSDESRDPHSPHPPPSASGSLFNRVRAFIHGHVGWVVYHDVPNPRFFAKDMSHSQIVRFFDRTHHLWVFAGIVIPGIVMMSVDPSAHGFLRGCIVGGAARIVISNQLVWAINSVGHTVGNQDFVTKDCSVNNLPLALVTFGEGWHNNHHAFPWSARLGLRWWQIDFGWWTLCVLTWLRLAKQTKQPTMQQIGGAK